MNNFMTKEAEYMTIIETATTEIDALYAKGLANLNPSEARNLAALTKARAAAKTKLDKVYDSQWKRA